MKHTKEQYRGKMVQVLPLVFDTFGTVYQPSLDLMRKLLPHAAPLDIMAGVVRANANYITRIAAMELNRCLNVRTDDRPLEQMIPLVRQAIEAMGLRDSFFLN